LYLPLAFEIICTELLPDRFFIFLRNIPKNSHATPNFKKRYLSISHLHHVFGRVRKTGLCNADSTVSIA